MHPRPGKLRANGNFEAAPMRRPWSDKMLKKRICSLADPESVARGLQYRRLPYRTLPFPDSRIVVSRIVVSRIVVSLALVCRIEVSRIVVSRIVVSGIVLSWLDTWVCQH